MPENYYSEFNENGVVTPLRDLAAFPRSEQAVLGAKNLDIPFNITSQQSASCIKTSTGYKVSMSAANIYGQAYLWYKNLPKNTDIHISAKGSYTVGVSRITIMGNNDPTSASATSIKSVTGTELSFDFNTGDYNYIFVQLWASAETSIQGEVTYSDFMLKLATDTDDTWASPAMTNKELTEKAVTEWSSQVDITPTELSSNGYLGYYENPSIHMACIRWSGNGTAPSSAASIVKNLSDIMTEKPTTEFLTTMRNGDFLSIKANFDCTVGVKTTAWSGAVLFFVTEPRTS